MAAATNRSSPSIPAKRHGWKEGIDTRSLESKISYLENQQTRMDYAAYRAAGLFIGSGVVEAGCKKVIGARFKCSGMFWSDPGAKNLLHIRAALLGQTRFDDFWTTKRSLTGTGCFFVLPPRSQ